MLFNQKRRSNRDILLVSVWGILLVVTLLGTGCSGGTSGTATQQSNGLFSSGSGPSAPTGTLQVRLGAEPSDQILACQLEITSIQLRKSTDSSVAVDLLPGANEIELTRLAATFEPMSIVDPPQDTYDQLQMVVSGATVTSIDSAGQIYQQTISSSLTSALTLSPAVTISDVPTIMDIDVDLSQTVQLDSTSHLITLNAPVMIAAQIDIAGPGGAPSMARGVPRRTLSSISNAQSGQFERMTGTASAVLSSQLTLVGNGKSPLAIQFDGNTVFEDVAPSNLSGMLVEVEGWTLPDGTLYADEVEGIFANTGSEMEGPLSGNTPSGSLFIVSQDGVGAGMKNSLIGAKVTSELDGTASYRVNLGDEDTTGLNLIFDSSHIFVGQRVEFDSYSPLVTPDWEGNAAQIQPYMVELLRQTLTGTVSNYTVTGAGTAEFDLALTPKSYVSILNQGSASVHVYQRSTTELVQLSNGVQNGSSITMRGFMFCTDTNDYLPPGTPLHFAVLPSLLQPAGD